MFSFANGKRDESCITACKAFVPEGDMGGQHVGKGVKKSMNRTGNPTKILGIALLIMTAAGCGGGAKISETPTPAGSSENLVTSDTSCSGPASGGTLKAFFCLNSTPLGTVLQGGGFELRDPALQRGSEVVTGTTED